MHLSASNKRFFPREKVSKFLQKKLMNWSFFLLKIKIEWRWRKQIGFHDDDDESNYICLWSLWNEYFDTNLNYCSLFFHEIFIPFVHEDSAKSEFIYVRFWFEIATSQCIARKMRNKRIKCCCVWKMLRKGWKCAEFK